MQRQIEEIQFTNLNLDAVLSRAQFEVSLLPQISTSLLASEQRRGGEVSQ